jgi:hypothetical protein
MGEPGSPGILGNYIDAFWWFRTPVSAYTQDDWTICPDGTLQIGDAEFENSVRPAIYLDPSTQIYGGNGCPFAQDTNDITGFTMPNQVGSPIIDTTDKIV